MRKLLYVTCVLLGVVVPFFTHPALAGLGSATCLIAIILMAFNDKYPGKRLYEVDGSALQWLIIAYTGAGMGIVSIFSWLELLPMVKNLEEVSFLQFFLTWLSSLLGTVMLWGGGMVAIHKKRADEEEE